MHDGPARPWWQTGVIYQIYPRSFMDCSGDGVGDLRGVTARLDHLSGTLGVDALWLSPFYRSPMADFGYDVADYTDVDPLFGDLADFDALVAAAHGRGLKILVDYVPNHTSDQHPWFIDARASTTSPRRDWYVFRDPAPGGGPPNNWLSVFGGSAWQWDSATGQYYLHSFLAEQPDLNWRCPAVRAAMLDVLRFWLDRGVDGFRIDVAHFVMKDPLLRDNPPQPAGSLTFHRSYGEYDSQLHLNDKGHEDVHGVLREIRTLVDGYPERAERVTIGEIHEFDLDLWASYYGPARDELHMPFNFGLLNTPWDARKVRDLVDRLEAALPSGAWPNYVLGNHDEPRLASRLGEAGARLAAVLLLTLRGTPTLYAGDEIGTPEARIPPEDQQDPWGRRMPGLGRDGCRTPMAWSAEEGAGFTVAARPWLPFHADRASRNVEAQLGDPRSILTLYRRLLSLRRATPALHAGGYRPIDQESEGCFVYARELGQEALVVALCFAEAGGRADLGAEGRLLLSTALDREEGPVGPSVELGPSEGVVVAIS